MRKAWFWLLWGISASFIMFSGVAVASTAISIWEYDQVRPRVAYSVATNEYLVVWEDHHWDFGAEWDIYGQRVSSNGTTVGGNFGISWDLSNHRQNPDVAYTPVMDEYLVVWEYEYSGSDHDIYTQRLASDGSLIEGEVAIATLTNFESNPTVTYNPFTDEFLIVWEHRSGSGEFVHNDIYGRRMDSAGILQGISFVIASGAIDESAPAVVCDTIGGGVTSGPSVSGITENTAMISWQTSVDSNSLVEYGMTIEPDQEKADQELMTSHVIQLSELDASSTYRLRVRSVDGWGNSVYSGYVTFETSPIPDGVPPTILIVDTGVMTQTSMISVDASDNVGAEGGILP